MSELSNKYKIAFEDTNPGGTTIIKIVSNINPRIAVGFAVYDNSLTGRIAICDGEKLLVLYDLLHFLNDERGNIEWTPVHE